jgi:hypothetical protein
MSKADDDDFDVSFMECMSEEKAECYTRILERVESTKAALDAASKEWVDYDEKVGHSTADMHPAKCKTLEAMLAWESAIAAKTAMIEEIRQTGRGWEALAVMAIAVMEELVNAGTLPSNSGGPQKYWPSVYGRILARFGDRLKSDPAFKDVRIMEFLTKVFVNRLPEFAEDARKQGKVMLAQAMEELAL